MNLEKCDLEALRKRFDKLDYDFTYSKHIIYNQTREKNTVFVAYTIEDIKDELGEFLPYIEYEVFPKQYNKDENKPENQVFCFKGEFINEKAFYVYALMLKGKL